MKKIDFNISISGHKEHVWDVMLGQETYMEWVNAAWPGSSYHGKWKEGEELRFTTADGSGTLAKLIACKPFQYILAEHIAVLNPGGIEDRDSDLAKGWIGTKESYTFSEQNGITELKVELDINPEWASMFNDGWPKST